MTMLAKSGSDPLPLTRLSPLSVVKVTLSDYRIYKHKSFEVTVEIDRDWMLLTGLDSFAVLRACLNAECHRKGDSKSQSAVP